MAEELIEASAPESLKQWFVEALGPLLWQACPRDKRRVSAVRLNRAFFVEGELRIEGTVIYEDKS